MIYSNNRISYDNINIDSSGSVSLCMEEVNFLFEDIKHSIFETLIEEDFKEALLLKEDDDSTSSDNSNDSSSSTSSNNNSSENKAKTEEVKKTLLEKIKDFFATLIEKIKNVISNITSKFMQVTHADRKLYEKNKDILNMKHLEGFEGVEDCFDIDKFIKNDSLTDYKKVESDMKQLMKYLSSSGDGNIENIKKIKEDILSQAKSADDNITKLIENKITWKPSSDNDIKNVINRLLNYDNDIIPKMIRDEQNLVKTLETIKNKQQQLLNKMNREEVSDLKEASEALISVIAETIKVSNKEISFNKMVYKDLRKRLIIMINYAKKGNSENNNEESKDNNDNKEETSEQKAENNNEESKDNNDKKETTQQEAYQFLLSERSDMYVDSMLNVSMTGLVEDSLEFANYVNRSYNNTFKNIGIMELREFVESDNIALYEGAKFDQIKESIIDFFKTLLKKIKEAYEKVVDKITDKTNEYYKKIGSNLKEIKPQEINELKNEDIAKNIGAIYLYDLDFSNYYKRASKYETDIYFKIYEFIKDDASDDQVSNYISDARSNYINRCTGIDAETITDLTKKLREKHETKFDPSKDWIVKNWSKITDSVKGGNVRKQVRKSYEQERKAIEKTLSDFKKLEGNENHGRIFQSCGALLKDISTLMNNVNSVNIDLAVKEFKINYMIAFKIAKMTGKWKDIKS